MPQEDQLAVRIKSNRPDHHIYPNNGRIYWVHYSLHKAGNTKGRVRESLRTSDIVEARKRRDMLFRGFGLRVP